MCFLAASSLLLAELKSHGGVSRRISSFCESECCGYPSLPAFQTSNPPRSGAKKRFWWARHWAGPPVPSLPCVFIITAQPRAWLALCPVRSEFTFQDSTKICVLNSGWPAGFCASENMMISKPITGCDLKALKLFTISSMLNKLAELVSKIIM